MKSRRADLLAVGAYVLLGLVVGAHYWADLQHRISSHLPTDNTWFEWLLAHGAYSVRHLSDPLFSDRQNAPDGVNMMANTSALGITIPLAPVTLAFGAPVAYAVWLTGALAATAATSYWALSRHLVRSRGAAFVGGAFLGFAPGVVHHANGQPNFLSNFLLPLIVVAALRLGVGGPLRSGLVLGLLVAYQVFVNEEMLLLTALACAVVVLAYAAQRRAEARARTPAFLNGLGVAAAVALVVTAYPIWYQFSGPQSYRGLLGGAFHRWGEDPAAYVTFARDTLAGRAAVEATIGRTEQNTWFGWPLVALALTIVVVLWRRSLVVRVAAVVAGVFGGLSLGPRIRFRGELTGLAGPWAPVPERLPLVEMVMPSRFSFAVVGAVGVLLAVAWDELSRAQAASVGRKPATARVPALRYAGYAAVVAALVPLVPTPVPARVSRANVTYAAGSSPQRW